MLCLLNHTESYRAPLWRSIKPFILLEGQGHFIWKIWNLPDIIRAEMDKREKESVSFPSLGPYKETISPFLWCWEVYGPPGSCNWWLTGRALMQQDLRSAGSRGTHTCGRKCAHTHVLMCLWRLWGRENNEFCILNRIIKTSPLPFVWDRKGYIHYILRLWRVPVTHLMFARWQRFTFSALFIWSPTFSSIWYVKYAMHEHMGEVSLLRLSSKKCYLHV